MVWAIGGLPKCRKFGCSGHTFGKNQPYQNSPDLNWILPVVAINAPVFCPYFNNNAPLWKISHTSLFCLHSNAFFWHLIGHIAHLRHFCILCIRPKSCFGGVNEQSGYLVLVIICRVVMHCPQMGPYLGNRVPIETFFGILGPYWVSIYCSGSLFFSVLASLTRRMSI